MTLKELREKRAAVAVQMRELHTLAEKEDRAFSADDSAKWAAMEAEIDGIDAKIKRMDKMADLTATTPAQLRAGGNVPDAEREREARGDEGDAYAGAFRAWLCAPGGMDALSPEQRELMTTRRANPGSPEMRAFAAGTGNVGGFTVPQGFLDTLEVAMRAFGGMMGVADVMRTDTGNTLPMPSFNYTGVKATIIGEGAASSLDVTTPFTVANLGSFTYRSPMLPVSWEFLQDTSFGDGFITDALGRSLAWGVNEHATIGTGAGQPRGVITDAVSGKVGATGQTVTVTYDDIVDLIHSIDPVYRTTSRFMMHDTTVRQIRKIKDSTGRPIWLPGYESGIGVNQPDSLAGYAYGVNQDVPVMAANARSLLFGDFKKYKLRIVRDVTMIRLVERYADLGQVGFQLFMRADGRLLDAGTNPVKFYQNSAT